MNAVLAWFLSALAIIVSLFLLVATRMVPAWKSREIFGAPSTVGQNAVWIGASLGSSGAAFALFGTTAGIATVVLASVFTISAFTDYFSAKAPKDLAYIGASAILALILLDQFVLRVDSELTGLTYVGISAIIVLSLLILLGILFPGGFGMADARLFLILTLATYWFTPIYLLVSIIGASAVQMVLRFRLAPTFTANDKKAYPYIPALTISSLLSIPATGLFLL